MCFVLLQVLLEGAAVRVVCVCVCASAAARCCLKELLRALERACWCCCRVLLSEWRVRFGAGLLASLQGAAFKVALAFRK